MCALVKRWAHVVLVVKERLFPTKPAFLDIAYLEFGKHPFKFNSDVNRLDPAVKA